MKTIATYHVSMLGPWHGKRVRITAATNQDRSTGIRLGAPITTAPEDYRELREEDYPEDGTGWFEGGYQNLRWVFNY